MCANVRTIQWFLPYKPWLYSVVSRLKMLKPSSGSQTCIFLIVSFKTCSGLSLNNVVMLRSLKHIQWFHANTHHRTLHLPHRSQLWMLYCREVDVIPATYLWFSVDSQHFGDSAGLHWVTGRRVHWLVAVLSPCWISILMSPICLCHPGDIAHRSIIMEQSSQCE